MTQDLFTIKGNLTGDPELRFTPAGAAVTNFTVASTPRYFDPQSKEWRDGEPLFLRCNIWWQAAENVAETLTRGARVIVSGKLKQRSYVTREGDKRTVVELDVDEVGPSLKYATAKVTKNPSSGNQTGGRPVAGNGFGQPTHDPDPSAHDGDPWQAPALAVVGGTAFTDDPGF
ncbi:single-stranded DNA-binding protein [Nocardia tengchongensis]|uniref:single-stranded DNA-binding protein n=1 Tax=Nocardia tengchongensis TaxID=2055889 RepID=UPI001FE8BFA1|nr:single-stranded DNA-binding protein [Nocardia tengchongensis]